MWEMYRHCQCVPRVVLFGETLPWLCQIWRLAPHRKVDVRICYLHWMDTVLTFNITFLLLIDAPIHQYLDWVFLTRKRKKRGIPICYRCSCNDWNCFCLQEKEKKRYNQKTIMVSLSRCQPTTNNCGMFPFGIIKCSAPEFGQQYKHSPSRLLDAASSWNIRSYWFHLPPDV